MSTYWFCGRISATNISNQSPTQSHQHNDVINITVTIEMSLLYEISLFKNYEKPTFEIWNLILGIFCVFIWFFILYFRFFLNGMAFKNRYRASFFSRIKYAWWGMKLTETYICSEMTLTYSGLLRHQKLPNFIMKFVESISMSNPTYIFNF